MRILCSVLLTVVALCSSSRAVAAPRRPNIVWIIVDDMSANFSCYGEKLIETPHVDGLARRGTRFTNCYVTAPVCSTCRSAFITGMYQTTIGAHHHRSGRGTEKIRLPDGVTPIPQLLKAAGYYNAITGWPIRPNRLGKTDYNFEWDAAMYDGSDWADRSSDQPFFAQIQLPGGKLRGGTIDSTRKFVQRSLPILGQPTKPSDVILAPYYPRDPVLLEDWAAYLDSVRMTDHVVGEIITRLRDRGELDHTIVLFMTDHGISHARGKQFLYDEGLHVPLVIAGPGIAAGQTRTDLVEHIDIAALTLAVAGVSIPDSMQARNILANDYVPRSAVFAARDRCDETVDHIRGVRTQRFKYIRNFLPERPYLQPNAYKDKKSILIALREAHAAGRLTPMQAAVLADSRPREELYDLASDPHEIHNLADDPQSAATLLKLRKTLDDWMEQTGDQGRQPESDEMFNSDMEVYLSSLRRRSQDPEHLQRIESNIRLMRQWASEGK